jgi:hypothetical protein
VADTTAPQILCSDDVTIMGDAQCLTQIPSLNVVAFDNCSPTQSLVVVQTPIAGTVVSSPSTTRVSIVVTDLCGNSATCTVRVVAYCRPGTIGDRVWRDIIGGGDGVQDVGEPGIADVPINLYSVMPGSGNPLTLFATNITDANGGYLFTNLPPGSYVVKVVTNTVLARLTQSGDPDFYGMRLVAGDRDNRTTTPIVLASGQVFTNADFGYWADPALLALIGNVAAFTRDGQTVVRWETIESWGTAGFYLERQVGDQWVRVSQQLLPYPLFGTEPISY